MGSTRTSLLVAALALVAAACATGTSETTRIDLGTPGIETPATEAPAPTSGSVEPSEETQPASADPPRQRPEGDAAPDFELALGAPGGTFSLSAENKPVFMVFWAPW